MYHVTMCNIFSIMFNIYLLYTILEREVHNRFSIMTVI